MFSKLFKKITLKYQSLCIIFLQKVNLDILKVTFKNVNLFQKVKLSYYVTQQFHS